MSVVPAHVSGDPCRRGSRVRVPCRCARPRAVDWPKDSPRNCARQLVADAEHDQVAVVFGRERSGMTNDEMDLCNLMVQVPTAGSLHSLNLAAAVQVVAYELLQAETEQSGLNVAARSKRASADDEPASAAQAEYLFGHLGDTLKRIGFLHPNRKGVVMRRLRSMVHRMRPTQREVQILRGILAAMASNKDTPTRAEHKRRKEHV